VAYTAKVFVHRRYTSDRGDHYSYKMLNMLAIQSYGAGILKLGGGPTDGTEIRPSATFRPRVVLLWNAANKLARRVIALSPDAPLYDGTVDAAENFLNMYAGVSGEEFVFTCYGYEGERERWPRA
jgi:hypothetical protein